MSKDDGGPVYPWERFAGLTLRDYFAAHAPEAPKWFSPPIPSVADRTSNFKGLLLTEQAGNEYEDACIEAGRQLSSERYMAWRYAYADAMIAERGKA